MRKKKYSAIIDDTDKALFHYLYSVKVAMTEQIRRDVYFDKRIEATWKRLKKLTNLQYLQSVNSSVYQRKKVLSITSKTFKSFLKREDEASVHLKSGKIEHDLALVDIRHLFINSPIVTNYLTENMLQTWHGEGSDSPYLPFSQAHSDAVFDVKFPNGTFSIALEYEATQKSKARNIEKIKRCYRDLSIPCFVFICANQTIMNNLISCEKEVCKKEDSIIYYNTFDKLKQDSTLSLTNRNGEKLQIGVPT